MPNLNDIAHVADSLTRRFVYVVQERCAAVRHRNASCRECVEACAAHAIKVESNTLTVNASACTSCGACTAICPTEALIPVFPPDRELAQVLHASALANDGLAVVACARAASKRVADPERHAQVACLGRMEESMLVDAVAHGATCVVLVDGNCATCKYGAVSQAVDDACGYANLMLEATESPARVERASAFPAELLVDEVEGKFGSTRRGFLTEAAASMKETATTAARATVEAELGVRRQEKPITERLRAGEDGTLPQMRMMRHETALNALDALGVAADGVLPSRMFASLDIDVDTCIACGMCAVFCPSGALKRDPAEKPSAQVRYLEFSAADCVQCGLCADVCWKNSISIDPNVSLSELFDFEPKTFVLAPSTRKSLF